MRKHFQIVFVISVYIHVHDVCTPSHQPKVHFFIQASHIDMGLQNNEEKGDYISFAYILYANFFNTDTRIVVHNIKCNTQQYLI